jgi:lysophospholipase L1-like esterase
VPGQLSKVEGERFDVIIISVGANDVWHLSNIKKLGGQLTEVLEKAKKMSGHRVLLLLQNNIGDAPIFPFFMRWYLRRRTDSVQELFRAVASQTRVPCIELFAHDHNNPFLDHPEKFFASDGIHPNGEGYRLWYNRMWRVMTEAGYFINR